MRSPALHAWLLCAAALIATACGSPAAQNGAQSPAGTPATPPAPPAPQTPAVLERYRQVAGLSSRDIPVRLRGTGVGLTDGADGNRRIVIQAEQPGRYRQFDGPGNSESPLRMTVFVVNGPEAWRVGSAMLAGRGQSTNPEERRAAEAAAARQNHINALGGIMPLWLVDDPAVTVVDLGVKGDGPFKGSPVVALKFGDAQPTELMFDAATGFPTAAVVPFLPEIRSTGGTYTIRYEDYRDVEGVMLPFRIVREGAERSRTRWMFRTWEINPTFPPTTFEKATAPGR